MVRLILLKCCLLFKDIGVYACKSVILILKFQVCVCVFVCFYVYICI